DHIGLDLFGKALANDRCRNMATAEAGNARDFLVFLDQRIGLPVDVLDRNLDLDFALGGACLRSTLRGRAVLRAFFDLSRAHNYLSGAAAAAESGGKRFRCDALCRKVECKDSGRATSNRGGGFPTHQSNGRGLRVARTPRGICNLKPNLLSNCQSPITYYKCLFPVGSRS